jgi:hypothetical protein
MSNWYKKSKIVDDKELTDLLSQLPIGDQMELFKDPMWDIYTKEQQIAKIKQKLG